MHITGITDNPLVFNIIILLASFAVLAKAADMLVYGISRYAKKMGLSDFIIGLLIIGFAQVPASMLILKVRLLHRFILRFILHLWRLLY